MTDFLLSAFRIFGIAGPSIIILTTIYAILCYRGKKGERFSMLNHFISELGEVGVSKAARIFNAGLFTGGVITLPLVIRLGLAFDTAFGWLGTAAGIVATLAVAAVGLFPMNNLTPHTWAAMIYFRAGLVMVFFFGLAILFQPADQAVVPHMANLLSVAAFLAYGAFLSLPRWKKASSEERNPLDPSQEFERPRVWALPILEWAIFFSTIAWLWGMAFLL